MRTGERRLGTGGQAILEYLIVILVSLLLVLGIIQLVLLSNARSVLELAAFHAARAATVARSDRPAEGVTLEDMRKRAELAAFVTLLPVLTGAARDPGPDVAARVAQLSRAHPDDEPALFLDALEALGSRRPQRLLEEFRRLEVSFVRADADDPRSAGARITTMRDVRFDDPAARDENLLGVLVQWRYPLLVPFVNRLIGTRTGRELPRSTLSATSVMRMQWHRSAS